MLRFKRVAMCRKLILIPLFATLFSIRDWICDRSNISRTIQKSCTAVMQCKRISFLVVTRNSIVSCIRMSPFAMSILLIFAFLHSSSFFISRVLCLQITGADPSNCGQRPSALAQTDMILCTFTDFQLAQCVTPAFPPATVVIDLSINVSHVSRFRLRLIENSLQISVILLTTTRLMNDRPVCVRVHLLLINRWNVIQTLMFGISRLIDSLLYHRSFWLCGCSWILFSAFFLKVLHRFLFPRLLKSCNGSCSLIVE